MDVRTGRERILNDIKKLAKRKMKELQEIEEEAVEINKRKSDAIDAKDLSENAAYDTACADAQRNEMEKMITYNWLQAYKRYDCPYKSSRYVGIGTTLIMQDDGGETFCIQIVPEDLGDSAISAISVNSPRGKAVLGKQEGDTVIVITSTRKITSTILEIY